MPRSKNKTNDSKQNSSTNKSEDEENSTNESTPSPKPSETPDDNLTTQIKELKEEIQTLREETQTLREETQEERAQDRQIIQRQITEIKNQVDQQKNKSYDEHLQILNTIADNINYIQQPIEEQIERARQTSKEAIQGQRHNILRAFEELQESHTDLIKTLDLAHNGMIYQKLRWNELTKLYQH